MSITFSRLASEIHKDLGKSAPLGHIHQALAAALGYGSFAAMQASLEEPVSYSQAKHFVIIPHGVEMRLVALACPELLEPFLKALHRVVGTLIPAARIHHSMEDFLESIQTDVEEAFESSGPFLSESAQLNADLQSSDLTFGDTSHFTDSSAGWFLSVEGSSFFKQHPDSVYHGHLIDFTGQLVLQKFGRRVVGDWSVDCFSAQVRQDRGDYDEEFDGPGL